VPIGHRPQGARYRTMEEFAELAHGRDQAVSPLHHRILENIVLVEWCLIFSEALDKARSTPSSGAAKSVPFSSLWMSRKTPTNHRCLASPSSPPRAAVDLLPVAITGQGSASIINGSHNVKHLPTAWRRLKLSLGIPGRVITPSPRRRIGGKACRLGRGL